MADTLTLVTLNTWKCDGDYAARLPAMADALVAARPDVVCLQEVLRAPGANDADTARDLAAATGLVPYSTKARKKRRSVMGRRVQSWSGLAILSRWEPRRLVRLALPTDPRRDGERLAQVASLATPLGPITLVNLHLTHPPEARDMRAREMATILDHLDRNGAETAVLAGDFNDTPDSPALKAAESWRGWTCRNAVAEAGRPTFVTFPETGLTIDHVLVLERSGRRHLNVVEAGPVGDGHGNDRSVVPSDHVGVRVMFSVQA